MIRAGSLYQACSDLFADYPLAVQLGGNSRHASSMILMRHEGGNAIFFVLTYDHDDDQPFYSINHWRVSDRVSIGPSADPAIPETFVKAITEGVPIPHHGSLLGWDEEGLITALVAIYAQYTPTSPVPSWATMPLADIPEAQWPSFATERLFGRWFWKNYQAGSIVALDDLIASTKGMVFWVNTIATLGSGCCVVSQNVRSSYGYVLQRGSYVYYEALQAGKPVPSLDTLLADTGKIDLASQFRRPNHSEASPRNS